MEATCDNCRKVRHFARCCRILRKNNQMPNSITTRFNEIKWVKGRDEDASSEDRFAKKSGKLVLGGGGGTDEAQVD